MAWKFFTSSGTEKVTTLGSGGGYGTSLPASPTDGQEFTLVDSVTAPTYQWRFRYNAGSSNAHKWDCIGGTLLGAFVLGPEYTTSTTDVDLATVGPSIVVPFTGVYHVQFGFQGINGGNTGGGNATATLYDNTTAVSNANAITGISAASGVYSSAAMEAFSVLGTAGHTFKLKYSISNSVNSGFVRRYLKITPVRVS